MFEFCLRVKDQAAYRPSLCPQLVAGSVVMAFEEVCPERIDLIHKNYRKLCNLLIDVEEWGQVVIINMLTRYARTQFLNPNANVSVPASPLCPPRGDCPCNLIPSLSRSPCWRRARRRPFTAPMKMRGRRRRSKLLPWWPRGSPT